MHILDFKILNMRVEENILNLFVDMPVCEQVNLQVLFLWPHFTLP